MPRVLVILAVLLGVVFAASMAALLALSRNRSPRGDVPASLPVAQAHAFGDPLKPDENVKGLEFPPFILTTHDGRTIDRSVFQGRITVVDFFFTHCTFVCPLLTQRMQDLARELQGTPVRFLSISVDPVHDTTETVRQYAYDHGADLSRWTFATGDRDTIGRIITGGLKFAVGENPDQQIKLGGGQTMNNILHPPWFALVGPDGQVLDIYRANLPETEGEMDALVKRARAAALTLGG